MADSSEFPLSDFPLSMAQAQEVHRVTDVLKYFLNERPFDTCLRPFTTPLGTFRFEYRNRPEDRFLSQFNTCQERAQVLRLSEDGSSWVEHALWRDVLEFAGYRNEDGVCCIYFFYPDEPKRHFVTDEHLKAFEPLMSQGIFVSRDGLASCQLLTREGPWNAYSGSAAMTLTPLGQFFVFGVFEKVGALSTRGVLDGAGHWEWTDTSGDCSIRDPVNLGTRIYAIEKIYDTLKFSGHRVVYSDDDGVTFTRLDTPEISALSLTKDPKSDAVFIIALEGIFKISLGSEAGKFAPTSRILGGIKSIEACLGTRLIGAEIRDYAWYKPIRFKVHGNEAFICTWEVDRFGHWVDYRAVAMNL